MRAKAIWFSFFGRLNYTLLNRYLVTFTLRNDGSSRFSPDNRWGLFPSVALAWKLNEESFLKNVNAISDLKLRLGYACDRTAESGQWRLSLYGPIHVFQGRCQLLFW